MGTVALQLVGWTQHDFGAVAVRHAWVLRGP